MQSALEGFHEMPLGKLASTPRACQKHRIAQAVRMQFSPSHDVGGASAFSASSHRGPNDQHDRGRNERYASKDDGYRMDVAS